MFKIEVLEGVRTGVRKCQSDKARRGSGAQTVTAQRVHGGARRALLRRDRGNGSKRGRLTEGAAYRGGHDAAVPDFCGLAWHAQIRRIRCRYAGYPSGRLGYDLKKTSI